MIRRFCDKCLHNLKLIKNVSYVMSEKHFSINLVLPLPEYIFQQSLAQYVGHFSSPLALALLDLCQT